jgi:hypothetical protein
MPRALSMLAGVLFLGVVPAVALSQVCNEKCHQLRDENGHHQGNACVHGTQGTECQAELYVCSIVTTGCGGETDDASLAASGSGAAAIPATPAMRQGWVSLEDGSRMYFVVPCRDGRRFPMVFHAMSVT